MVATLLADRAATAVTAALAGRLMAATRLVAVAATEFWSLLVTSVRGWLSGLAAMLRAAAAVPRSGEMAAAEEVAAMAAMAALFQMAVELALVAAVAVPVLAERAAMAATELAVMA